MNRTRTLAGVLTLSALTFSFAEAVLASMCTPMPQMPGMGEIYDVVGEMGEMTTLVAEASSADSPDCPLMSGENRDAPADRDAHCPLSPAVGAGCSAVASLPSTQIAAVQWTAGTALGPVSEDAGQDLLLTHRLFRPPRA